jgi:DNA-directed RNA polymerase subunit RPC12/RpoP
LRAPGVTVAVVAMLMDVASFPPSGGAIGGAVGGAIVGLMMAGWGKRCSRCGTELPAFRKPTSLNQALKGGWTCPKCGTEVDRNGNEIKGPAA